MSRFFCGSRLHKSKQKLLRTERLLQQDTTAQNDPQNSVESRFFCGSLAKCAAGHMSNLANKENDSPNDGRAAPILTAAAQRGDVLPPRTFRSSPSSSTSPSTAVKVVDNPLPLRPGIFAHREEHTTTGGDNDIPSASTSSPSASTSSPEVSTSISATSTSASSPEGIRRRRSRSKVFHYPLSPDVFVQTDREGVAAALVNSFVGRSPAATLQVTSRDQSPLCGPSGSISGQSPIGGPLGGISEEEDVDTTVTRLEEDFDHVAAVINRINSDPLGFPLHLIRKKFYR
mmetsp:Transcript_14200/g.24039  ORF Transcript_14200/g.24039 Transcript_14200/m.24039 type:complete len:287 (-) Transcript_14200:103-963(-)